MITKTRKTNAVRPIVRKPDGNGYTPPVAAPQVSSQEIPESVGVTFGTNGTTVGVLSARQKEFKTGSRGFYANGKVEVNGRRYQVQVQLVEIGSKSA